ncbi:cell division protein FtsQ/DivIB [Aureivirga sp. CE67]|uniref:cell division protein FtsQ/DivIB n=1 Tax=Aureivirga sp. CE67 TaxID=1788983 RepID=UPI0018CA8784|nr:cell division protein FtsQ/DivIB [Aureivirga sp. CE67]
MLIVFITFLYGFATIRNARRTITDVSVEFEKGENFFLTSENVIEILKEKRVDIKNQLKSKIDVKSLEEKVNNHPMIESADIYVSVDGKLHSKIKQREPIGRVQTKKEVFYIDQLGEKMPLSKNYSARVPLFSGDIRENNLEEVHRLLNFIKKDAFLEKQVIAVTRTNKNEYYLKLRIANQKVLLGTIENLESKINNLKALYKDLIAQNKENKYKLLNLKYSNQVVCVKN